MRLATTAMICSLVWTLDPGPASYADGPTFTSDVTVSSTNPDFVLQDTDGVSWSIEGDEPIPDAISISHTFGTVPVLVIENSAPASSFYIGSNGDIGLGTGIPGANIHIRELSTAATIRMQAIAGTGSVWDLNASSTAFSIVDSFGSSTPFVLEADSPTNSIYVGTGGDISLADTVFIDRAAAAVGIGTDSPAASLHVMDDTGTGSILIEETNATPQKRTLVELSNNGAPQLLFRDTNTATTWELNPNPNGNFIINRIGTAGTALTLTGSNGNLRISGDMRAGDFIVTSSRHLKEGFCEVDEREILRRVVELPISEWNFQEDRARRHLGPMAEDFKEAFGLGAENSRISMIDASGVALAAIKGLKTEQDSALAAVKAEKDSEIAELKNEVAELKRLVAKLVRSAN